MSVLLVVAEIFSIIASVIAVYAAMKSIRARDDAIEIQKNIQQLLQGNRFSGITMINTTATGNKGDGISIKKKEG